MIKNRLREVREEKGISQAALAKKCRLSRTVIAKIEKDEEAVVTTKTIVKLADALGVNPTDIFLF